MTLYNPAALAGLAWDLGGGWGFSDIVGGYAPVDNELRLLGSDIWVFDERAALSYTRYKWNLTANVIYGLTGKDLQTGRRLLPDYLNVDLTAVKTLGNWEAGAVAFYSTDLESIAYGPGQCGGPSNAKITPKCEQAQFAAGGLIGYGFSGITTQLWATTDMWTQNYLNGDGSKSYEKRVWARVIIALWTAPKEAPSSNAVCGPAGARQARLGIVSLKGAIALDLFIETAVVKIEAKDCVQNPATVSALAYRPRCLSDPSAPAFASRPNFQSLGFRINADDWAAFGPHLLLKLRVWQPPYIVG